MAKLYLSEEKKSDAIKTYEVALGFVSDRGPEICLRLEKLTDDFTYINRGLYVALTASLLATYIRRHAKLTEKQDYWVEKASQVAMGVAIVLFGIVAYQQYFSE